MNFVDPDGAKIVILSNSNENFKKSLRKTFQYMGKKGTLDVFLKLKKSPLKYCIVEGSHSGFKPLPDGGIITWDNKHIIESDEHIWRSPATVLDHEGYHALIYDDARREDNMEEYQKSLEKDDNNPYDNKQEEEVISSREQNTARKHNEIREDQRTRKNHKGHKLEGTCESLSPEEIEKIIRENNELL